MGRESNIEFGFSRSAVDDTPLEVSQLEFGDGEERLPWLETGEDDFAEADGSAGRLIALALAGLVLLVLLIGAIWWFTRRDAGSQPPRGSVIAAPSQPYKTAPANPGGKPMAGTGDTSYAVSEGETRTPHLDDQTPDAAPTAATSPVAAATPSGVGVQVGAYGSRAKAEAGWSSLVQQSEALKGLSHRVLQGSADIGTVYRLQAVTADRAEAGRLCAALKGQGIACQVK